VENQSVSGTKENTILLALHDANQDRENLSMRAIFIDSRHIANYDTIRNNIKYVAHTMARNDDTSKYLVGYDLVSEEDTDQTTHSLLSIIDDCIITQGNHIYPTFYFHDGETTLSPGHGSDPDEIPLRSGTNDNLVDAYLINTIKHEHLLVNKGRIGHAIGLYKDYGLMERFHSAELPIEICPISNQLLQYVPNLRTHLGQLYLSCGIPCSLGPDDPAIFGYQGVTYDFWEACVAWNLGLKF